MGLTGSFRVELRIESTMTVLVLLPAKFIHLKLVQWQLQPKPVQCS